MMTDPRTLKHSKTGLIAGLTTLVYLSTMVSPGHTTTSAIFYRLPFMDDHIIYTPAVNLENTLVAQRNVTTRTECAATCLSQERCVTFFYYRWGGACLMHSIVFLGTDEATVLPGTTYWQLSQERCPIHEGFILFRPLNLCYNYNALPMFWQNADETCNNANTQLLKVSDPDTSLHIYQFLRGSSSTRLQHVSIGAIDKQGTLLWTDGSVVNWTNWGANEPSHADENCTVMAWFFYFKWNDVPCNTLVMFNFICQKVL